MTVWHSLLPFLIAVLVAQAQAAVSSVDDYLHSQLTSYEVLDPARIVAKRSLSDDVSQHLYFTAFSRKYHLVLRRTYSGTASTRLTVQVMQGNVLKPYNASSLFHDFVSGYVEGSRSSRVSGYFADNQYHLTIDEAGEVLTIEPLSLLSGNQYDKRLLAYYDSSLNSSKSFCGLPGGNFTAGLLRSERRNPLLAGGPAGQRQRRAAPVTPQSLTRVCRLQLVADYTFVQKIASGSVGSTVKCLIKIADDINSIYQATRFTHPETILGDHPEVFTGIGFELANLVVLENPETDPALLAAEHFNSRANPEYQHTANRYLEAFGDYEQNRLDLASYCLNHLVTFRPMQQNILGLAYLGSPYPSYIGGICSPPSVSTYGRQRLIGRNIGMATYANKDGNPILSRQALLVSAHELGHNMGSEHDPVQTGICTPTWTEGGPYLMYQIAVTGSADHHSRFSECSSKQIAVVIKAKQGDCFHEPRYVFCGNRRREAGEQCDAGPEGDPCCDTRCQLRPGAKCSDANSPCCTRCQLASADVLCQRQSALHPCQANTNCDGRNDICPTPANLRDNTECQFGVGICRAGKCESVCVQLGREPCSCEAPAESCLVCCQRPAAAGSGSGGNRSCEPYRRPGSNATLNLPANQPCVAGRCLANGTCQRLGIGSGQIIVRLWDLIVLSGSNSVATFLWKNIVFTVITLSLLLWVPACMIIAYQDRLDAKKSAAGYGNVAA